MKLSKSGTLNTNDLKRIGLHLAIVAIAAVVSEVLNNLGNFNLGTNTVLIVPVVSLILKTLLTFLQGK